MGSINIPSTSGLLIRGVKAGGKYLAKTAVKQAAKSAVSSLTKSIAQYSCDKSIATEPHDGRQSELETRLANAGNDGITLDDFFRMVGEDKYDTKRNVRKKANNNKGAVRFVRSKDQNGTPTVKIAKAGNKVNTGWCFRQNVSIRHNQELRKLFGDKLLEAWKPFLEDQKADGSADTEYGYVLKASLEALRGLAHGWKFSEDKVEGGGDGNKISYGYGEDADVRGISGKRLLRTEVKEAKLYFEHLMSEPHLGEIAKSFLSQKFLSANKDGVNLKDYDTLLKDYGSPAFDKIRNGEKIDTEHLTFEHLVNYIVRGSVNGKPRAVPKAVPDIAAMKERMKAVGEALGQAVKTAGFDQRVDAAVDRVVEDSGNLDGDRASLNDLVTDLIRKACTEEQNKVGITEKERIHQATESFLTNFFQSKQVDGKTYRSGYFDRLLDDCRRADDKGEKQEAIKEKLHFSNLRKLYADYVSEFKPAPPDYNLSELISDLGEELNRYAEEQKKAGDNADLEAYKAFEGKAEGVEKQIRELVKLMVDKKDVQQVATALKEVYRYLNDQTLFTKAELEKVNAERASKHQVPLRLNTVEDLQKIFAESLTQSVGDELANVRPALMFVKKHPDLLPDGSSFGTDLCKLAEGAVRECTGLFLKAVEMNKYSASGISSQDLVDLLTQFAEDQLVPLKGNPGLVQTSLNALTKQAIDAFVGRLGKKDLAEANKMAAALKVIAEAVVETVGKNDFAEGKDFREAVAGLAGHLQAYIRRGAINENMKTTVLESVRKQTVTLAKGLAMCEFLNHDLDDLLKDFSYQTDAEHFSQFKGTVNDRIARRLKVNVQKSVNYGYQLFYSGVLNQSNGEFAPSVRDLEKRLVQAAGSKGGEKSGDAPVGADKPEPTIAQSFIADATGEPPATEGVAEKKVADGQAETVVQKDDAQPPKAEAPKQEAPKGDLPLNRDNLNNYYTKEQVNKITDAFTEFLRKPAKETGLDGDTVNAYVSVMREGGTTFHPLSLDQQKASQRARLCDMWAEQILKHAPGRLLGPLEAIRSMIGTLVETKGFWNGNLRKTDEQKAEGLRQWLFTPIRDKWVRARIQGLVSDMETNAERYRSFEAKFVASCRACVGRVLDAVLSGPDGLGLPKEEAAALQALKDYSPDARQAVVDNILSGLTGRLDSFMLEYTQAPGAYADLAKDSGKMDALVAKLLGMPPRYGEGGLDESAKAVAGDPRSPIMQALAGVIQIRTQNVTEWLKAADPTTGGQPSDGPCYEKTEAKVLALLNARMASSITNGEIAQKAFGQGRAADALFLSLTERRLGMLREQPLTAGSVSSFDDFAREIADAIWNESQSVMKDEVLVRQLDGLIGRLAQTTKDNANLAKANASALSQLPRLQRRAVETLIQRARTGTLTKENATDVLDGIMRSFTADFEASNRLAMASNQRQVLECVDEIPKLTADLKKRLLKSGFDAQTVELAVIGFGRMKLEEPLDKLCGDILAKQDVDGNRSAKWKESAWKAIEDIGIRLQKLGQWQVPEAWESQSTLGGKDAGGLGELLTSEIAGRARKEALEDPAYRKIAADLAQSVVRGESAQELENLKDDLRQAYTAAFEKSCRRQAYAGLVDAERQNVSFSSLADHMILIGEQDQGKIESELRELDDLVAQGAAKNLDVEEFRRQLGERMTEIKVDIWIQAHKDEVNKSIRDVQQKFILESDFSETEKSHDIVGDRCATFYADYHAALREELKQQLEKLNGELPAVDLTVEQFNAGGITRTVDSFTSPEAASAVKAAIADAVRGMAEITDIRQRVEAKNHAALKAFLTTRARQSPGLHFLTKVNKGLSGILRKFVSDDKEVRDVAFNSLLGLIDSSTRESSQAVTRAKLIVCVFFTAYYGEKTASFSQHADRKSSGGDPGEIDCNELWNRTVGEEKDPPDANALNTVLYNLLNAKDQGVEKKK